MIENIKLKIAKLLAVLNIATKNLPTSDGLKIYQIALSCLGTDASPNDLAPDELGCAETVSTIINKASFKMPIILSTREFYNYLNTNWLQVSVPLPGDIILSPTGFGGKNGVANGHTGIVGTGEAIMSNNSSTGKFERNYTLASWKARYADKGGYPVWFFRKTS